MHARHESLIPEDWKKVLESKKSIEAGDNSSSSFTYVRLEHAKFCRSRPGKCPICIRAPSEHK